MITEYLYTNIMALHVAKCSICSIGISYNVHGHLHLSDDDNNFGYLDSYSAFPVENFM